MGLNLIYEDGQTPLSEEEKDGLLIHSVTTKAELDEVEQRNVEEAILYLVNRRKRFSVEEVLSEKFIKELHARMFSGVWKWAGDFRTTEKNIGVMPYMIGIELRQLLDDCKYWIENKTYSHNEIAIRFKHRIVVIHCFSNGNGRHSRLIADVIAEKLFGLDVFTWGGNKLVQQGTFRKTYLNALKSADRGEFELLMQFSRS